MRTRILTALVLLLFLGGALVLLPPEGWGFFLLLIILPGLWEWGLLSQLSPYKTVVISSLILTGLAFFMGLVTDGVEILEAGGLWSILLLMVVLLWCIYIPFCLRYPLKVPKGGVLFILGIVFLLFAWLGLWQMRLKGADYVLSALGMVWIADSVAYFVGRRWGRRRLAPLISPKKTWEGVLGAVLGVQVLLLILVWLGESYVGVFILGMGGWRSPALDWYRYGGWLLVVLGGLSVTILAILGDLFESLLKRRAGVKDSGRILPGHGGVLDRIDALLPVIPLVCWIGLWV